MFSRDTGIPHSIVSYLRFSRASYLWEKQFSFTNNENVLDRIFMRSRGDFTEDAQKQQVSRTAVRDATLVLEEGDAAGADRRPGALESSALSQHVADGRVCSQAIGV